MKISRSKVFLFLVPLFFGSLIFSSSSAMASTCPTSFTSWTSPYFDALGDRIPVTSFEYAVTFDNFNDWLNENNYPSVCDNALPFSYYQQLTSQTAGHSVATTQDVFSKNLSICLKGQTLSIFNLGSLISWSKCVIQIAFVPSSTVLVQDLHTVQNSVNTHVPMAYGAYAISFANKLKANWGADKCVKGDLGVNTSVPDSIDGSVVFPLILSLPCQPPAGLNALRKIAVISVYGMVVFFTWEVYKRGVLILNGS